MFYENAIIPLALSFFLSKGQGLLISDNACLLFEIQGILLIKRFQGHFEAASGMVGRTTDALVTCAFTLSGTRINWFVYIERHRLTTEGLGVANCCKISQINLILRLLKCVKVGQRASRQRLR